SGPPQRFRAPRQATTCDIFRRDLRAKGGKDDVSVAQPPSRPRRRTAGDQRTKNSPYHLRMGRIDHIAFIALAVAIVIEEVTSARAAAIETSRNRFVAERASQPEL